MQVQFDFRNLMQESVKLHNLSKSADNREDNPDLMREPDAKQIDAEIQPEEPMNMARTFVVHYKVGGELLIDIVRNPDLR